MSDPSSRRAARLARLVILSVALPSLLLTGLGVIAVANEEAAARKRLVELYAPIGSQLANRFNEWIQSRMAHDADPLAQLARWARQPERAMPRELAEFLASADHATNFFVIEPGRRVYPQHRDEASPEVEAAMLAATSFETLPDCRPVRRLAAATPTSAPSHCPLALAAAVCGPEPETWRHLESTCPAYAEHPAAGATRGLLAGGGVLSKEAFLQAAQAIRRFLGPLAPPPPPWLSTLVARRVAGLVQGDDVDSVRVRHALQTVAHRESLLRALEERLPVVQAAEIASEAVATHDDWRRAVIARSVGRRMVGYELLPDEVAHILGDGQNEEGLAKSIRLAFHPIAAPDWWWGEESRETEPNEKKGDENVAWLALLKRTDIAWSIALELQDEGLFSLGRSRKWLYTWALILTGIALVSGLAFTLRAVNREGQLSRLKTDFVSSVSHDLRTPLTSIRMFTESLLMGRVQDPERQRQYLEVIAEEAERLSRLTERILDFSRMEAGRKAYAFHEVQVRPLFEQTLRSCQSMLDESEGQAQVEVDPDVPDVEGDRDALVEMLINLVTNAIKYSEDPPRITLRARSEGRWVVLEVEDQGIGISATDQKRIFEKFHRVDCRRTSEVGGCGIGLSLVQHIVESHRGEVSVRSAVGRGSTFSVRLRTARPQHAENEAPSMGSTPVRGSGIIAS